MKGTPLEEFLRIVRRDLSAEDARIVSADEPLAAPSGSDLRYELSGGRLLVVTFASPPSDLEARARRAEMLVESFNALLEPARGGAPNRPPPARSLHEELRALAERAGAHDAIVIDARSPVVWGAALSSHEDGPGLASVTERSRGDADEAPNPPASPPASPPAIASANPPASPPASSPVREVSPAPLGRPRGSSKEPARGAPHLFIIRGGGMKREANDSVSERALRAVRALPEMVTLHRGGQLLHTASESDLGFVARSFAGIYVLLLAFQGPFDELRAKRAIVHALPVIEKLVLALPPQDPAPLMGGVVALRPRLRRRR